MEELSHKELFSITGGSTAQDAQKGAVGGVILGGGVGVISGYRAVKDPGLTKTKMFGATLGAVLGGGLGAANGAAFSALGGAILKEKPHN
jgi:bacteriocin-like protein